MPKVSVKWGKVEYKDVDVDASASVEVLKAVLFSLSGEHTPQLRWAQDAYAFCWACNIRGTRASPLPAPTLA